jgi:hypothetical protein
MIGSEKRASQKRGLAGRLVSISLLLAALMLTHASTSIGAQEPSWQPISPVVDTGLFGQPLLGAAPTWPVDRLLFIMYKGWLARTDDDGATWVRLPTRFARLTALWPAPDADRSGIVLALDEPDSYDSPSMLMRSADRGATWTTVLTATRSFFAADEPRLTFTPTFQDDGIAFLRMGQRLHRTIDFGASWTQIDVDSLGAPRRADGVAASGQLVLQTTLSPAFAVDRTVFAVVATAPYYPYPAPQNGSDTGPQLPPLHHLTSLGLIVSRDGGDSWQWASDGLTVGGVPYRFVANLEVSPTFAQDQTLFALAWGPAERYQVEDQQRLAFATALFRSQDGAQTWEAIWNQPVTPTDADTVGNQGSRIILSPTFAVDGTVVASFRSGRRIQEDYTLRLSASRKAALASRCDGWRTTNAGASWIHLDACPASQRPPSGAGPSLVAGSDGIALGTMAGQIVARGIDGPATPGMPACPFDVDAAFAPMSTSGSDYGDLGCPTEPAQSVRVLDRSVGSRRGLWPVDDSEAWVLIQAGNFARWDRRSKATDPWTGPPDAELDAVVQRFWGGQLLRLTTDDGTTSFLLLRDPTPREPDTPYLVRYDAQGQRP